MSEAKRSVKIHAVIPDVQTEPGESFRHVGWIGQYLKDEYSDCDLTVVNLMDWWSMDSLSTYDRKGGQNMEGRRYIKDIDHGNAAMDLFNESAGDLQARWVATMGNHEERIVRAAEADAQLEGVVSLEHLNLEGWEVHPFLEPVWIDGICYSHYFANPMTGRPYSGANIELRLKQVGHTFTMGHQQGRKFGEYQTLQGRHQGLVVGSCYLHDPKYLGFQCTNYWRGIVMCHDVKDGQYDPMFVSLEYLCKRYEGKTLSQLKWRK